jgi:hypothetical protein
MEEQKPQEIMTCREAGRRGGQRAAARLGSEGYSELGKRGGAATRDRYGAEHFARLGRASAAARAVQAVYPCNERVMGRELRAIHNQIMAVIPEKELAAPGRHLKSVLQQRVQSAVASSTFAAPEMQAEFWREYARGLGEVLGYDDKQRPYLAEVRRIFAGETGK